MKIGILGTGLIGGSFALAMKKSNRELEEIIGFDRSGESLDTALALGIINKKASSIEHLVAQADQIYIAIPVQYIEDVLPAILDQLNKDQFVVDFGSTKEQIGKAVSRHGNRKQYIAAHPIAGTEYSGPGAAFADLFENKVMILCDKERSDSKFRQRFEMQCELARMKLSYLSSQQHDEHLAFVSHLSHILSFALSNTVLSKEKEQSNILDLAGSGFESTVRLAKSSPDMWVPIFLKNQSFLQNALKSLMAHLQEFSDALQREDQEKLMRLLENGRKIRKILV